MLRYGELMQRYIQKKKYAYYSFIYMNLIFLDIFYEESALGIDSNHITIKVKDQ